MAVFRLLFLFLFGLLNAQTEKKGTGLPNPILFVTQVPVTSDFTNIGATFGTQNSRVQAVPRGGDLFILYPDGTLRNLTQEAGFGNTGFQGANAIAVRDPAVHWDGSKAIFSMVVGSYPQQFQWITYFWQLYEITGLGQGETAVITKVAHQPTNYNNIQPVYASDDRILFSCDRPIKDLEHVYPMLDEYEEAPTPTGIWSLNPATGELYNLNHTPSGAFTPIVDSFGRVIFTRWDHLQRDQQADADNESPNNPPYGTFNYSDESATAVPMDERSEFFPEPRVAPQGVSYNGHTFNHFFPWQINQDGTSEELINHVGRHELTGYFQASFNDDPSLIDHNGPMGANTSEIENFLLIREDPTTAGRFYGIDAPEFGTHSAGQIIALNGGKTVNPNAMAISYVTHRDTATASDAPSINHSGLYRDILPLSDGTLIASHTTNTRADQNIGTGTAPLSRFDFQLKRVESVGASYAATTAITPVINIDVSYFDPDQNIHYQGPVWQMRPVEVVARQRPNAHVSNMPSVEAQVFSAEGVDPAFFKAWMQARELALIVSRNVTTRDAADRQQPFNLAVEGTGTQTTGDQGKLYNVMFMQLFQADHLRGIGGVASPREGRRVIAQPMHDAAVQNPPLQAAPAGSVQLGQDGSMAAFVPARRAMTWQLTDSQGEAVVRERYWLTFQPGEVRVCASCHGVNQQDQSGLSEPENAPEALHQLLQYWKTIQQGNCTLAQGVLPQWPQSNVLSLLVQLDCP